MDISFEAKPGTSRYSVASVPQEDHIAIPLQIQRLEKLLVLHPYLDFCEGLFKNCVELSDHTYAKEEQELSKAHKSLDEARSSVNSQQESLALLAEEKPKLYNFERVGKSRKWLQELLLANSSDEEPANDDEEIEYMKMCQHLKNASKQKYQSNPEYFARYKFYGAGLLSAEDRYVEHQEEVSEAATPVPQKSEKSSRKQQLLPRQLAPDKEAAKSSEEKWKSGVAKHLAPGSSFTPGGADRKSGPSTVDTGQKKRGRKKKEMGDEVESLTNHRRKIWCLQCSKEVKKMQKAILGTKKENLLVLKRLAVGCSRIVRQKALQSEKAMKETSWRCKRISKEIQAFWKRTDRVEKTQRKQAEQEAKEQRRQDLELMEAKRQQRKLNFLITQTELYAHFMSRKLGGADPSEEGKILGQLDEEKIPRLQEIDSYDSQVAKQQLLRSVSTAFRSQQLQTRKFDTEVSADVPEYAASMGEALAHKEAEYPQPSIFQGSLKHYQLKGMNWISSIYNQGINGILADEMGLGKTVQSIAFLAHLAERYGIWGPFLIISPTSTLHNWQQEFAKFVPAFKVIPYWGSPQERKILRQFWSSKNLHTQESSFHVVITSYQMIVTDYKYFQRIKWQYMILDEAQAIKSSASTRWKTLLGFNCRNRLLLSGTPIQNNMAELWALLHFIMPTLFDSHDEFNEWFSKDIEGTAESKGSRNIDEKHLTRLHMILKPFMLRRIKKDVENELSEKIEIMMYCPLTWRQKALYDAVKKKIRIEDLLYSGHSASASSSATSNLMNIVMQLRKVCNHPELFERRDVKSPFHAKLEPFQLPKLIYREGILSKALPSKSHILEGKLTIWQPDWILRSLDPKENGECQSEFSFLRFVGLSIAELIVLIFDGILARLRHYLRSLEESSLIYLQDEWKDQIRPLHSRSLRLEPSFRLSQPSVISSPVMKPLVFTSPTCAVHSLSGFVVKHVRETIEHRIMRTKKKRRAMRVQGRLEANDELLPEVPFLERKPEVHEGYWVDFPSFSYQPCLKATAPFCGVYCSDRSASWWLERHQRCTNSEGLSVVMNGEVPSSSMPKITFSPKESGGILSMIPKHGWSALVPPDKDSLVGDSGKMRVLDGLLKRLKDGGHRVLIYSQMTRVIDLLEEYLRFRHLTYIRLDGSSRIAERRDMVADFQSRSDIFVFLLSTRAGGLGLNLTAADTVIFYDSDWNPTVDEQAMDRAHRLGQTKQVTVYRLICKGTVEERILQRAREKSEIQRMVISGGQFKPETSLKPKEVVSLLLDDDELEKKYRQRRLDDEPKERKKRKGGSDVPMMASPEKKRKKFEPQIKEENGSLPSESATPSIMSSAPASPAQSELSVNSSSILQIDEDSDVTEGVPASRSHSPSMKSPSVQKTYSSSNLEFDVSPLLPGLSLRSRPFRARGVGRRGRPAARRGRGMSRGGAMLTPGTGQDSDEEEILRVREQKSNRRGPGRPRTKPPLPANHVPRARGRPRGSTAKTPVGLISPTPRVSFPPPGAGTSNSVSRLSDDDDDDF